MTLHGAGTAPARHVELRVRLLGADTEIVSTEQGPIQAFNHLDKGDTFPVDQVVGDAFPTHLSRSVCPNASVAKHARCSLCAVGIAAVTDMFGGRCCRES